MRIAYVIPSLQKPSGWRTHANAFIHAICKYIEPVLFVDEGSVGDARQLFPGVDCRTLPVTQQASLASWQGRRALWRCYWQIQKTALPNVDLVHSLEAYPTGLVGSWLARRLGCPLALTAHGTYGVIWHEKALDRRAYRGVLRSAKLVCPVSTGTARMMQQYFAVDLGRTRLQPILNGNDFIRKISQQEALQRVVPSIPTILSVGDVKPRKGHLSSLAAFAKVKQQLPEARYWIAGSCPQNSYFRELQQFIDSRGLREASFLGAVSDEELDGLYRQASVFVLTPKQEGLHFEGFGLVYLEAGAYGLPVVAGRSGGVADAVLDRITGFIVDPEDVDGIAQALLRLLTEPELALEMGHANRRWAETLSWERCAEQQYQAYQEILGQA